MESSTIATLRIYGFYTIGIGTRPHLPFTGPSLGDLEIVLSGPSSNIRP